MQEKWNTFIACSPVWGKGLQLAPYSHHGPGPVVALLPTCSHISSRLPLGHGATRFFVGPTFFSPEGSRWNLPCDVRWGFPKGVANPLPVPLKDVKFYRLLSCSFPQILVANGVLRCLQQYWSFSPSDVECGNEGPGCQHCPGHPTASKLSTGCHFALRFSRLYMSSLPSPSSEET